MPKFCNKCGSPVSGPFCGKCGADTRTTSTQPHPAAQVPQTPAPQIVTPAPAALAPTPVAVYSAAQPPVAATPAKGSPLAKIVIGVAVVLIAMSALAAGGVYYVVHRVKEKVHEVMNGTTSDDSNSRTSTKGSASGLSSREGNPCRYLSKEDVSRAIGVEIVDTKLDGESCSYLAKGDQGEMSAKHAAKMLGAKGADEKTQKMIQAFGQAVFSSMPQEKQDQGSDASGNVPVLAFSVSDSPASVAEMNLNAKGLGHVAQGQTQPINIGDQAFVTADSMMMVRKGKKIIRIMFMTCPCGTAEIEPLAKKIADAV